LTDAHAQQYYFGSGTPTAMQSGEITNYIDDSEDAGFGDDLRHGLQSHPDGDNDTDDIGAYRQLPPPGGYPPYGGGYAQ
jgi:hypothetical protein